MGSWTIALVFLSFFQVGTDLQKVQTAYDATGRPANQSEKNRGRHTVTDQIKLGSGSAIVTLNTSTENGKVDVSFTSNKTYSGNAWPVDTANANTYYVKPLTYRHFKITSSDPADTATVRYRVEGD